MSCLILRAYLKTTYRGFLEILAVSSTLQARLGLTTKLPHYSTLQKFSARRHVVAMDSTGLATSVASEYFRNPTGSKCNQWVKVSVIVLCTSLIPVGVVLSLGPSNDRTQVPQLLEQAQSVARPERLYADGG